MLMSMKPEPAAGTLRILIVDDNSHFLAAASAMLEQDGVTVVGVTSNSADALALGRQLRPDGILVDIDLGEENGLDLARTFASSGGAPVVLTSAYPEAELADLIAASPAVGFVSKSELSASAVRRLIVTEPSPG